MQPTLTSIPTRSERQAMDWSLVLASQGIETAIDRDLEANTWRILVRSPDYSRALQTLRQYVKENKGWGWPRQLPFTGMIFDWRSVFPMALLLLAYAVQDLAGGRFRAAGLMDSTAVHAGQWWRLLTAVMLHADLAHLSANVVTGFLLVGLAMGAYGAGVGLLGSLLAGVLGNVAGLLAYGSQHQGLGASGVVLGALGLLSVHSLAWVRSGHAPGSLAIRALFSSSMLLLLFGVSPKENVDLVAHVVGFGSGLALGVGLAWIPARLLRSVWTERFCLAAVLAAAVLSWSLALLAPSL